MKKILLTLVGLSALMSIHAQVVEVYNHDKLVHTYYNNLGNNYKVVFKQDQINDHDFVEIAGTKWATMNVGATTVAESAETAYGNYYTWGEIDTYYTSIDGDVINFKKNATGTHITGVKGNYHPSNYCGASTFSEWDPCPYNTDGVLLPDYDVARREWGETWRMPTIQEFQKLCDACDEGSGLKDATGNITKGGVYWVKAGTTVDDMTYGVDGALFVTTADPATRLFFPMAGNLQYKNRLGAATQCTYWSSSISADHTSAQNFDISTQNQTHTDLKRWFGLSIRPVKD